MKKTILSLALLCAAAASTPVFGQVEVSGGVKIESNLSKFRTSGAYSDSKLRPGGSAGGFLHIGFSDYFALRPELLASYKTSRFATSGSTRNFKSWGLELPVYAVGQLPLSNGRLFAGAGPYIGYGLTAKSEGVNLYKKQNGAGGAALKRFDYGAGATLGYEFAGGFTLQAAYRMGLADIRKSDSPKAGLKNRTLSLGVGFKF